MQNSVDFLNLNPSQRREATIDIGPLMDMVFILLIFFVVTSTFTRETGVEVSKPQAQTASQLEKENILIAITRDGTLHIDERQVDLAGLSDILRGILAKNPEREAVLIADKDAITEKLVSVIDACTLAGVRKVSIAALNK
ncbi:MAG: biopolymer transporter ExbD [Fibromonadales bacterium]|nr:biopolymer transporter ExbD [Fibromonadales bacterium]